MNWTRPTQDLILTGGFYGIDSISVSKTSNSYVLVLNSACKDQTAERVNK